MRSIAHDKPKEMEKVDSGWSTDFAEHHPSDSTAQQLPAHSEPSSSSFTRYPSLGNIPHGPPAFHFNIGY